MSDIPPRWMNREQTAAYVGRRVDQLPRLVRAGKLPKPCFQFGPRIAAYDRELIDAMFQKANMSASTDEVGKIVNEINSTGAARRAKKAGRRNH